jgi:hypothetical protein
MTLMPASLIPAVSNLLASGQIISSPGGHFQYRIMGPCCRLFDREQLPWPCCRLEWRGKEPSWRRIGRRFILDMASQDHPAYSVELIGYDQAAHPLEITLYSIQLSPSEQEWWYAKKLKKRFNQPISNVSSSNDCSLKL